MIGLDLSAIYKQAFNINLPTKRFFVDQSTNEKTVDYFNVESVQPESFKTNYLGVPVQFPIIFKKGNYKAIGDGSVNTLNIPNDYQLPDSAVSEFKRSKNIISTNINGSSATVNELFSFADWQIKIYGVIIPTLETIEEQIKTLLKFENLADAINVQGYFFELYNIDKIVINDIDLIPLPGQPNVMPFTLNCKSAVDLDLLIN